MQFKEDLEAISKQINNLNSEKIVVASAYVEAIIRESNLISKKIKK